jgi:hypothetical protein
VIGSATPKKLVMPYKLLAASFADDPVSVVSFFSHSSLFSSSSLLSTSTTL